MKNGGHVNGLDPRLTLANGGARRVPGHNNPPRESALEAFSVPANSPGGAILAPVDGFLGLSSAADAAHLAVAEMQFAGLWNQIQQLEPDHPGVPSFQNLEQMSQEGRIGFLRQVRFEKALVLYRVRGDYSELQTEIVPYVQSQVDLQYREAVKLYDSGQLNTRLNRNEAIGNYIDVAVRDTLRNKFRQADIKYGSGRNISINNRFYENGDASYTVPDLGIGRVMYDWTMTAKNARTPQVQGFFRSQNQPNAVVIIRPTEVGSVHTYLIARRAEPK